MSPSRGTIIEFIPLPKHRGAGASTYEFCKNAVRKESARIRAVRKKAAAYILRRRNKAWKEGYDAGLVAGEHASVEKRFELQFAYERALQESRNDSFELALSVAREILKAEVSSNLESIRSRIDQGISKLLERRNITISVHPEMKAGALEALPEHRSIVQEDPMLYRGDIRISNSSGDLLLSLEAAYSALIDSLGINQHRFV